MASVQNFIKWFKERTRKQNKPSPKASIMRLGKLPPVPPRDEYGFTMKNTEHIYEEIHTMTSEEELNSLKSDEISETYTENMSQTLQKFDFTNATEIGPYLVVPIVSDIRGDGNESCDSGTGDLADLILSGSINDSQDSNTTSNSNIDNRTCSTPWTDGVYDYSKSLYNSIPAWARAKLKDAHCKRHGLALKDSKVTRESSNKHDDTFNEYNINDISSISSCSDHVFSRGQKLTNRCCGSSDSSDSAKTFSEYDIENYDDPLDDKNYEYFLVKAEKNFLLEKELKKYIDETSDCTISSSGSSQSDSMSLTTVTSMSDMSSIFAPGISRSDSDVRMSDDSGDTSLASDQSCCCRGQENSLFCAKSSKSVNSVLLVHKRTPHKDRKDKSRRNRPGSRDGERSRDSEQSRRDSKSNSAYRGSKTAARRYSFDDVLSSKSPPRRRSADDLISSASNSEYTFTRSNTMPVKELEKQIRRDMRKSQRDYNDKERHEQSRKHSKETDKTRKHPKEYKLPGVSKEYVFSTDSEYKFCTISNSKPNLTRTNVTNPSFDRKSDRYSCRATDFVMKKSGRVTSGATSSTDETYGSIYGTLRGRASQTNCQNRLLGDMMRMNHDRQLFF